MMIMFQIERSIHFLQALVVDDATEGEEELQAQLAADPRLPAAWAALLAEDSISVRGVLDMPLVWVEPDMRRHKKRDANKLLKLWKYALLMHTPPDPPDPPVASVCMTCVNAAAAPAARIPQRTGGIKAPSS